MLTKNKIKLINSLTKKKYRKKEGLFFCEGEKISDILINSDYEIVEVFATDTFFQKNKEKLSSQNLTVVTDTELKKISALTTPQQVLALVKIPENKQVIGEVAKKFIIALDKIQDPGNLGTIIRIADWFGVDYVVCSDDTVDLYNPKVVQATMGALFSTKVIYTDLAEFLRSNKNSTIYGTFMEGENIYQTSLPKAAIVVLGNEANGISAEIEKIIEKKLAIPSFNPQKTAESLNVAVATAIICSEFKRN